jgi:tetratricopeptide (TPR) repeat protein
VRGKRLAALFFPVLMTFGVVAQGATKPQVAVVVRGVGAGADYTAGFVAHELRQSVQGDARYQNVALAEALGHASRKRALRDFQAAVDLVKRGRAAYEEFELEETTRLLGQALAKYERNVAYLSDFKTFADLLMLLGAVYSLQGDEGRALEFFSRAFTVYNAVEPDPSLFNPAMRQQFDKAVSRLTGGARGSLALTSNPGYAEVYLDGNFVGITPVVLEGLLEGRHYVRMKKDGFRGFGKPVEVRVKRETTLSADLKPTKHFDNFDKLADGATKAMSGLVAFGDSSPPTAQPLPEALEELGALLNVDLIFWAEVRLDGEQVRVVTTQVNLNGNSLEDKWVKTASLVFSYDSNPATYEKELGAMYRGAFADRSSLGGGAGGWTSAGAGGLIRFGDEVCFGVACTTLKSVFLAAGVGIGVLGMGAGAFFWDSALQSNDQYRGNAGDQPSQISARAQDLRNEGETQALLGDLCFGLGAALALGTTVWAALYQPAPSVEDVTDEASGGWGFSFQPSGDGGLLTGRVSF